MKQKKKIPSTTKLDTTTDFNAKINEVKNKIPNISNLRITIKITEIKNKITSNPDHNKHIMFQEFTKLAPENFTAG